MSIPFVDLLSHPRRICAMSTPNVAPFLSIRLDKDSPNPIYLQIAEGIGELLKSGALPAGYVLPPERALCERFGISRMTLRQAMGLLDREGLIESRRGRGTVVTPARLRKQQQELKSFSEEIRDRGGRPESRLISLERKLPGESVRDFFELGDQQKVYEIHRLRLKDGEPLALEFVRIPERLCPGLERFDIEPLQPWAQTLRNANKFECQRFPILQTQAVDLVYFLLISEFEEIPYRLPRKLPFERDEPRLGTSPSISNFLAEALELLLLLP